MGCQLLTLLVFLFGCCRSVQAKGVVQGKAINSKRGFDLCGEGSGNLQTLLASNEERRLWRGGSDEANHAFIVNMGHVKCKK